MSFQNAIFQFGGLSMVSLCLGAALCGCFGIIRSRIAATGSRRVQGRARRHTYSRVRCCYIKKVGK
jgi:hypothetical protein